MIVFSIWNWLRLIVLGCVLKWKWVMYKGMSGFSSDCQFSILSHRPSFSSTTTRRIIFFLWRQVHLLFLGSWYIVVLYLFIGLHCSWSISWMLPVLCIPLKVKVSNFLYSCFWVRNLTPYALKVTLCWNLGISFLVLIFNFCILCIPFCSLTY